MEDEKNNSTVQFDCSFEPLISFNNYFDYTYNEEIELQSKDITIEIDSIEDKTLYDLLSSILNAPLELVSDSPMARYINIKKPNVLRICKEDGKVKIILKADRSEASTSVFLNSNLVDLSLIYKLFDALAQYLNILGSAEIRKLMYTNYERMIGGKNEN